MQSITYDDDQHKIATVPSFDGPVPFGDQFTVACDRQGTVRSATSGNNNSTIWSIQ